MPEELHFEKAAIDRVGNAHFMGELKVGGKVKFNTVQVTTTSYTVSDTDFLIECTNTTSCAVALPDAAAVGQANRVLVVKDGGASNNVVLTGGGSSTIDTTTTCNLGSTSGCLVIMGNGTNWKKIAKF